MGNEVCKLLKPSPSEEAEAYLRSDERVTITPDTKDLNIVCTWAPQAGTVYIGIQNTETDIFYILPSTGGAVSGTIGQDDIPEGVDHSGIVVSAGMSANEKKDHPACAG